MLKKIGAGLVLLLAAGLVMAYVNRDALVDRSIRNRLQQPKDLSYLTDRTHIRVLLCGTGSPEVSAAKAQACTLVSAGGKMFLFDVGGGAVRALAAFQLPDAVLGRNRAR